jgi:ABC-2 type transport system permease protein
MIDAGRVREMVRKEFLQVFRDPRLSRVIFVAPVIQLIIFGYAVSTDVRNTRTFLVDHDRTQASRQLVDAFTGSGYFRIVGSSDRSEDIVSALDHAEVVMAIEIPAGFAKSLGDGSGASVQLLFDGSNSNMATIARGYAERIVLDFGVRTQSVMLNPAVDLRERAWYNPALVSRNYNVPAVVGSIVMMVCLLLTALAIVREREIGTLEQLMVSPLRPAELIAGKTIPFALLGLFDLGIITTVALLWFRVPFTGSFLLLLLASLLYLLSGLGIGLLISTVSNTQQEAFMLNFLIFMPVMLLSGFMFPVSSMPEFFQWVTIANPMRHYLEIVRAIFLKGVGLDILWPQYAALLVMGVSVLWFATIRFHRIAR